MIDKKEKNLVVVTGYLKENTLEQFVSKTGKNAIRGNLIIATGPLESHRIQFFISETNSNGMVSKDYQTLLELLPTKTTTLASYLAANPGSDYETACSHASKVWAAGYFDEYTRRNDKGAEFTSIQLRGRRAGYKTVSADRPFEAKTRFEVEMYISELTPELDIKGDPTGRMQLVGLLPNYDQSVIKINFVAPTEDGIADYISKNYAVSDTVHVNGSLVNIMNRVLSDEPDTSHFGAGGKDQYITTFVNERKILGGDAKPVHEGENGSITKNAVKIGLAKREAKIAANSQKQSIPQANFEKRATSFKADVSVSEDEVDF